MMDDLISRRAAIDAMRDMYHAAEKWGENASEDMIKARAESCMASLIEMKLRIENLPSAVVRCGDCKFWTKQTDSIQGRCALFGMYPTSTWFCGNARRREDDPNT